VELTDFLMARTAEDEAMAREWPDDDVTPGSVDVFGRPIYGARSRVLADCEAKRRIVAEQVRERHVIDQGHVTDWTMGGWGARHTCLRALASIYRAHPDFDPAWEV